VLGSLRIGGVPERRGELLEEELAVFFFFFEGMGRERDEEIRGARD
jgi:hypothetical protein